MHQNELFLPVEISSAVNFPISREALLIEDVSTVHTSDTVGMPGLLQHGEDILVQNRFVTMRAHHQHGVDVGHKQCLDDIRSC